MRQRADNIELIDAGIQVITNDVWDIIREERAERIEQMPSVLPDDYTPEEEPTVLLYDEIIADINFNILDFWTRRGDDPRRRHTYHGTFLVHWSLPKEESKP